MNRTGSLLCIALLCGGSLGAVDHVLPASALTVERFIPLAQLAAGGVDVVDPNSIYSDVTGFLGLAVSNGGAAAGITRLLAEDATFTTNPAVGNVSTLRFAVANLNAIPHSVRARVRFWNADGPPLGGGLPNAPGNYYAPPVPGGDLGFTFNPFTFGVGVTILSGTVTNFSVPAGVTTTLWLGMTFDNVGTVTGATDADLNNFGMGLFNPVDRGSSTDTLWLTTAAGSFFGTDNPVGAALSTANPDNVGWELVVTILPVELLEVSVD